MLSTREIIRGLSEQHFIDIRVEVQSSNFKKELIPILDKYRSGEYTESEVCEDTNFTLKEFKLFEKRLHNLLVDFYKITPRLELDTVLSQAFHALYSKNFHDAKEKNIHLEKIFNKMQSLHLGEEGLEVIKELMDLKKDTELYTVYYHLYNHYLNRYFSNQRSLILINQFFHKLGSFDENDYSSTDVRRLIFIYKQLRMLSLDTDNPLAINAFRICQLSLCVLYGQEQLLFQERISVQKLMFICKNELKKLPGNFERYYFNNIYMMLKLKWANNSKDLQLFNEVKDVILQDQKILDANNFNFKINKSDLEFKHIQEMIYTTNKPKGLVISSRFNLNQNFGFGNEKRGTLYN